MGDKSASFALLRAHAVIAFDRSALDDPRAERNARNLWAQFGLLSAAHVKAIRAGNALIEAHKRRADHG